THGRKRRRGLIPGDGRLIGRRLLGQRQRAVRQQYEEYDRHSQDVTHRRTHSITVSFSPHLARGAQKPHAQEHGLAYAIHAEKLMTAKTYVVWNHFELQF